MKLESTDNWLYDEVIDTKETEVIEENIYVDEDFIKNRSLIRMDLNLIQYPIFSKNTKRKENQIIKYFFNKNRDTYITVIPSAGNYIPGEAEEKVFIALMKIMKQRGMPRKFVVTSKELKEELNLNTGRYIEIVKDALLRLSSTTYNFKNTMYSSEKKSVLSEEVQTAIMSLRILKLSDKDNLRIKKEINDNRVKEVYEISVSDHFYKNIVTKGYLVYNSDILLSIDTSTARTIYMLIEKLRFNEFYLKIDTLFLIKRIPLKFSKSHMSRTIKILESNLQELKDKNLIESFNFIKESTWEKSEIEIFFNEEVINGKQERFFDDLNDFKRISTSLAISDTEHDLLVVSGENECPIEVTKEMVEKIFNALPTGAKKLKSMPKTIADNVERYGYEKVLKTVIYLSQQKNLKSPRAYFLKALESDWAVDIVLEDKIAKKEVLKETQIPLEEKVEKVNSYEKEFEYFNSLSSGERAALEEKVYRAYIKECGQETKIQKLAFNAAKNRLIGEYILKNKILENSTVTKIKKDKMEITQQHYEELFRIYLLSIPFKIYTEKGISLKKEDINEKEEREKFDLENKDKYIIMEPKEVTEEELKQALIEKNANYKLGDLKEALMIIKVSCTNQELLKIIKNMSQDFIEQIIDNKNQMLNNKEIE